MTYMALNFMCESCDSNTPPIRMMIEETNHDGATAPTVGTCADAFLEISMIKKTITSKFHCLTVSPSPLISSVFVD